MQATTNRGFRVGVLIMGVLLVAAACSRPATDTKSALDADRAIADTETDIFDPEGADPATGGPDAGGTAGPARTRTGADGEIVENPYADEEQVLLVGSQIKPQSVDVPNGNWNTWTGVNREEIILAPGYDKESCGADIVAVITAAGGALPTQSRYYRSAPSNQEELKQETEETIDVLIDYFNNAGWQGFEQFPQLVPLRDKFGTPDKPFYGRRLKAVPFDSGSFQCPEKTTSAATKVADEIKAFSAFIDRWDGAPTNMAASLKTVPANRRPMMFGTLWLPDSYYRDWAPYVWTTFSSGSTILRQKASWVCSRLAGQKASNSPDFADRERKFGLLYPNRPEDKDRASEFKAYLKQFCGLEIPEEQEKSYTFSVSTAQAQGQSIMLSFQRAGVTSIFMLTDPVLPLFFINYARGQAGYDPEYIFSSVGYADSNTVQRLYDLNRNGMGVSQLGIYGGFGYGAGDPFWAYHSLHRGPAPDGKPCDPSSEEGMSRMRPDGNGRNTAVENYCKAPTPIATYYYTILPLIGGIVFSGPDLKPEHVSKALQNYPRTRYGGSGPTKDPRPALVGAGPNQYHFIVDAVEWRWRTGYISPYPEHKKEGWVEYPDCQRHYLLWPDQMADFWERDGENFNAWCGDPKYAPEDSPEKDGYPRITEGRDPM